MAEGFDVGSLGSVLGPVAGIATSQSASGWIGMGINIILSTIVGGIVLLVVMEMLSKAWGESVNAGKVFMFLLIINVINTFGVLGILYQYIGFIPMIGLILPLLLWIGFMKLFFGELSMLHAAIAGIIGFALSMFVIPIITGVVLGMLPLPEL